MLNKIKRTLRNWCGKNNLHRDKVNEIIQELTFVQNLLNSVNEGLTEILQFMNLFIILERIQNEVVQ